MKFVPILEWLAALRFLLVAELHLGALSAETQLRCCKKLLSGLLRTGGRRGGENIRRIRVEDSSRFFGIRVFPFSKQGGSVFVTRRTSMILNEENKF